MVRYREWDNSIVNDYHRIFMYGLVGDHPKYEEIKEWCKDNIHGKIMKTSHMGYWIFEDEADAVAFKLRWS